MASAVAASALGQQRLCASRQQGGARPAAAAPRRQQQAARQRLAAPKAAELAQLAALDIDWSDPDTQIGAIGAVLGLALGVGIPAFYARWGRRRACLLGCGLACSPPRTNAVRFTAQTCTCR